MNTKVTAIMALLTGLAIGLAIGSPDKNSITMAAACFAGYGYWIATAFPGGGRIYLSGIFITGVMAAAITGFLV